MLHPARLKFAIAVAAGSLLLASPVHAASSDVPAARATAVATTAPADVRALARELFEESIAFKTSEGMGQVSAMAHYLADRFRAAGFAASDIHVLPSGDTAALVVRYRGTGRGGKPIVLAGHMDVVTAKPEDWQRDPFRLIEENGYFYGRGTMDNKADVVLMVATLLRLKAEGFVPTRDLVLALTGDEETTAVTTRELVTKHRHLVDGEYVLNSDGGRGTLDEKTGEALFFSVQGAEKSYASYTLTTRNPGGHSSQPRPDNAIYDLAGALSALQAYEFPVQWNDWTLGNFAAAARRTPGTLGAAMTRFAADPEDAAAAAEIARVPALAGRLRTTCVATLLAGGHAENALPQSATATVNCRIFPGTSAEEVRSQLQSIVGPKVEVAVIGTPISSPPSPLRQDVLAAVEQAVRAVHPGVPVVPDQAPYATDGTFFRGAGLPTYGVQSLFMKDSDDFSHGLDERVPVASFYDGLTYWYVLLRQLTGEK
jgi:acetylornithine deacetylase/succinyl-diaminopimelate desuccinylase-like protein